MDGAAARGGDGVDGWWCIEVLVDGGRGEGGGAVERWRAATPIWPRRRPEVEKEVGGEGDGDARLDLGMDASRDFDPHLICHFYDLALLFYSFLPKKIPFFF